jgi:NAD(P)-dependent dehydrogenase (short-subunit alcohol dehydrogenase family)
VSSSKRAELRFDGQVAIVTGAGGNPGLGRSHALLLAQRGAKVVVNDLGVGPDGSGRQSAHADQVAAEIVRAGGEAVANMNSVADEAGAQAIVRAALETWGRLDILINNAGIGVVAGFDQITSNDIQRLVSVHLMGHIWMSRAAWKPMVKAGYGRIVNTTSGGMFGMAGLSVYGAAKFGIYGLTRGLAVEGAAHNIKVNALSPGAATRSGPRFFKMKDPQIQKAYDAQFTTERVSPAIAYLAHESCDVTGALLDVGGGNVSSRMICSTPGINNPDLSIEDVRDGIDAVFDQAALTVVTNPRLPNETGIDPVASLMTPTEYIPG